MPTRECAVVVVAVVGGGGCGGPMVMRWPVDTGATSGCDDG